MSSGKKKNENQELNHFFFQSILGIMYSEINEWKWEKFENR
jgi:hypothetical protein